MITHRCAGAAILGGLLYLTIMMVYPNGWGALRLLAYLVAFNMLPGLALILLAGRGPFTPGVLLLLSWTFGLFVNLLVVTVLWLCGALGLLVLLPALSAAGLLLALRRTSLELPSLMPAILAGGFLCVTPLLSFGHILADDPGYAFSFHAAFQGVIVRGLEQGWPPQNLMLPDVPLAYNYLAHLWVLGATQVTALPLDLLVARLAPIFLGGTAAAALFVTGRLLLGLRWWIAAMPVLCLFWVTGIPAVGAGLFANFMPYGANLILSPYPAMVLFLGTLLFLVSERPADGPLRFLTIVILAFLTTGARGVTLPLLLCAGALHALVVWRDTRRIPLRDATDLAALLVGFAIALWVFFRVGSGFSGTGFVRVNGHPFDFLVRPDQYLFTLPHWLMRQGATPLSAGGLSFLVIAIFHGGFLAPAVPAGLADAKGRERKAVTLLAGASIAGICAFFFTEAPGYSHVSFLYYSGACISLLGARGLQRLLQDLPHHRARFFPLAAILALVILRSSELPGPATNWLITRAVGIATGHLNGANSGLPPLVACRQSEDTALFDQLPQAERPVVIFLPRVETTAHHCKEFWLIVAKPVQSISSFALSNVPGSGDGAIAILLAARTRDMNAALAQAAEGKLSVENLLRLRRSLDPKRPVYVLADQSLRPDTPNEMRLISANDNSRLWRFSD